MLDHRLELPYPARKVFEKWKAFWHVAAWHDLFLLSIGMLWGPSYQCVVSVDNEDVDVFVARELEDTEHLGELVASGNASSRE